MYMSIHFRKNGERKVGQGFLSERKENEALNRGKDKKEIRGNSLCKTIVQQTKFRCVLCFKPKLTK